MLFLVFGYPIVESLRFLWLTLAVKQRSSLEWLVITLSTMKWIDVCTIGITLVICGGIVTGLPGFMKTLIEKLTAHIKRECPICVELGEPCGAIEFCTDPLDVIYPFQVYAYIHASSIKQSMVCGLRALIHQECLCRQCASEVMFHSFRTLLFLAELSFLGRFCSLILAFLFGFPFSSL